MLTALHQQAGACGRLGSPFMARLLTLLAEIWPEDSALATFCAGFEGDIGASGHSLPLRLASALHALVLRGDDLSRVYPPNDPTDTDLRAALAHALSLHEAHILRWMKSPPQTNEVRRSAALIPAAHWLAAQYDLPFVTSELGASAGLNMGWDRYRLHTPQGTLGPDEPALTLTPEWEGPLPAPARITVVERAGVDLTPLDPHDPDQQLRLLSYLWPDQPERLHLTRSAIAAQQTAVEQGDAVAWLEQRLTQQPGRLHLIYHTITWQYFPPDAKARGTAMIEDAGARATPEAPLAWLQVEDDGQTPGAGIHLRLWPGDERAELGRVDFHGRWLRWAAPAT